MSRISRELHIMLQASVREALARRHHYVTVEHLLFAMVHDARGSQILYHAGADLPALKAALDRYFRDDLEQMPGEEPTRRARRSRSTACSRTRCPTARAPRRTRSTRATSSPRSSRSPSRTR